MEPDFYWRSVGAWLLILATVLAFAGATLWSGSNLLDWPASENPSYLIWERGFLLAAMVVLVLGMAMLESALTVMGEVVLARLGFITYFAGTILGIVAESYLVSGSDPLYALLVVYVLLAFLGQTAFGISLLITKMLPAWIGWATMVYSVSLLVIIFVISPTDIYYPISHYVMPLVIGIALWMRRKPPLPTRATHDFGASSFANSTHNSSIHQGQPDVNLPQIETPV